MAERFDLIVVGAGPGGYVAAIRAAQLGLSLAVVDKSKTLGGTCLNVGCIPSKALLDSSELYHAAKHRFARHGIEVGEVALDLPRMLARKADVVKGLTDGIAFLMRKNKIAVHHGTASLAGNGVVRVRSEREVDLVGKAILLATGSEPAPLPFLPFDGQRVVSSTEALAFDRVPERLVVVGGGYIGLELGSVWSRLGSQVVVLEFLPKLLPLNDGEVAAALHKALTRQGLDIRVGTQVTGARVEDRRTVVTAKTGDTEAEFPADKVLVCVGRRPLTRGLDLEAAGVSVDAKSGKVTVDDRYRTTAPGVYAIGDLVAGPMLAHKASEEGIAVAESLAGKAGHVNYATIPSVIYTHPEVAAVGLTEEQARETGRGIRVGKFPFAASGRAKALDEVEGFAKVIADAKTDRLLGMHVVGPRASDLIAEGVLAMEFGASAEDVARACHAHPSLGEAVGEAARAAWSTALHG